MSNFRLGVDIGSTTIKMVLCDPDDRTIICKGYRRHCAQIKECLADFIGELRGELGERPFHITLTGSVGMGVAERYGLPFIQEVVAAANYVSALHPTTGTMIDIGGEDAKMVFFADGAPSDLRMNGNCAGGTGAFIDQMAVLLDISPEEMGKLASDSTRLYPVASRCGVFSKTDIQNLMARNVPKADIAASIFHAVAVQTVTTLAHGHEIDPPVLLCGGPLTFIPALRDAFSEYLHICPENLILPVDSHLIPAWGAALRPSDLLISCDELERKLNSVSFKQPGVSAPSPEIFSSREEYEEWKNEMSRHNVPSRPVAEAKGKIYLGIDSGSTTTKIVALDESGSLIYSFYDYNGGAPVRCAEKGLREFLQRCDEAGTTAEIAASCSTGYGEDLIKAAFAMDYGIVETMAHYEAARHIDPEVSFILDIGGQDMKAMFIENGAINRIEVNEACSSGCGSFISTFAETLGLSVDRFAEAAALAKHPSDLGTRCTVFMNSKVKQVLREGASVADIAAGLSYSVVRNCLYKVLRLKDTSSLGDHIVVQGGTMRNDSIVRVLERLTGKRVLRCNIPELTGALGCALYAMRASSEKSVTLNQMLESSAFSTSQSACHGCENKCIITRYKFSNNNIYFSGNRCEKIFTNRGSSIVPGRNAYEQKRRLLFDRKREIPHPRLTVGIPRSLNAYEEYPFWHTLFSESGIEVRLSDLSTLSSYERCAGDVMADNICFPAKLVHSHIADLQGKRLDRIFLPFVVYEKADKTMQNSYNCPIVSGYSQVIKSVRSYGIPIDSPTISFKDEGALFLQCRDYLSSLGIEEGTIRRAFRRALAEQKSFEDELVRINAEILREARGKGAVAIMLAGRPYHSDPLIPHKVSEMIAAQGAYVLTDDLVRNERYSLADTRTLPQWAFTNRIMKAARWAAGESRRVQFMQLTSFGCGPDAFLSDEIRRILHEKGKNLTLLKIDDVSNIGSLKLRVRSLLGSLGLEASSRGAITEAFQQPLQPFTRVHRKRKLLVPFFTPFLSPLIPPLLSLAGYEAETLPMSDAESGETGLKYSNNEICYPATLIVGDIVKALKSGRYDPKEVCVAMTQTGGQCRASNYLGLIQKALEENGFSATPLVSIALGSGIDNYQPGFKVNWLKILPAALDAILYSDFIARLHHASVVRENVPGAASGLKEQYLFLAQDAIRRGQSSELYGLMATAARDYDRICLDEDHPKVGIVGEIFLKFHPFAQKNVTGWLEERGIEVEYPSMTDFFLQGFVNAEDKKRTHLGLKYVPSALIKFLYRRVASSVRHVNSIGRAFRYFYPFEDIFGKAELARKAITLSAQFGEGWLIAGEIGSFAHRGIRHIVSLQPFGCIANHIVQKGIENRLKALYPQIKILSLDFDSSVSEVNITNRLLLFINDINRNMTSNDQIGNEIRRS